MNDEGHILFKSLPSMMKGVEQDSECPVTVRDTSMLFFEPREGVMDMIHLAFELGMGVDAEVRSIRDVEDRYKAIWIKSKKWIAVIDTEYQCRGGKVGVIIARKGEITNIVFGCLEMAIGGIYFVDREDMFQNAKPLFHLYFLEIPEDIKLASPKEIDVSRDALLVERVRKFMFAHPGCTFAGLQKEFDKEYEGDEHIVFTFSDDMEISVATYLSHDMRNVIDTLIQGGKIRLYPMEEQLGRLIYLLDGAIMKHPDRIPENMHLIKWMPTFLEVVEAED